MVTSVEYQGGCELPLAGAVAAKRARSGGATTIVIESLRTSKLKQNMVPIETEFERLRA
jgi:hypothetical protein